MYYGTETKPARPLLTSAHLASMLIVTCFLLCVAEYHTIITTFSIESPLSLDPDHIA